jgi:hypothetical protein
VFASWCRWFLLAASLYPDRSFIGDFVLLLSGGLLFVTFHSMLEGIRAEEENKEFI